MQEATRSSGNSGWGKTRISSITYMFALRTLPFRHFYAAQEPTHSDYIRALDIISKARYARGTPSRALWLQGRESHDSGEEFEVFCRTSRSFITLCLCEVLTDTLLSFGRTVGSLRSCPERPQEVFEEPGCNVKTAQTV